MTPLEKASQMIVDYQLTIKSLDYDEAVQCSIRTVDAIIEELNSLGGFAYDGYWQEVKQLLEKQSNKMTLRHALLVLQSHQKWRMGDEFAEKTEPKVLTEAISTILQYHIGSTTALIDQVPDVGKMVEISDEEIIIQSKSFYVNQIDDYEEGFIDGAQWYREQLKKKQNGTI